MMMVTGPTMAVMKGAMMRANEIFKTGVWAMEPNRLRVCLNNDLILTPDDDTDDEGVEQPYENVNGVAVVPLVGTMVKYDSWILSLFGGVSTVAVKANLQAAIADPSVDSILMYIDSPGGEAAGTAELATAVANSSKPVVAYVSDLCASGAYYVASQADRIICNPSAFVGSIGVYTTVVDSTEAAKQEGYKVTLVAAGEHKGEGAFGVPITDSAIAETQKVVDAIYELFVAAVAQGRGMTNDVARGFATGQVWFATEALKSGLVDGIVEADNVFNFISLDTGVMSMKKNNKLLGLSASAKENSVDLEDVKQAEPGTDPADKKADEVEPVKEPVKNPVDEKVERVEPVKAAPVVPHGNQEPHDVPHGNQEPQTFADGLKAGVEAERARLSALKELAPDDADFVLGQFLSGATAATAAVTYARALSAELTKVRGDKTKVETGTGQSAIRIGAVEQRNAKAESLIRLAGK